MKYHDSIRGFGQFSISVNGGPKTYTQNIIVDEGIEAALNILIGEVAKINTWYIAPFLGNVTPQAGWTAANFAANSTEFTNYVEGARPTLVEAPASGGTIGNDANLGLITVDADTAAQDTIWGLGLLSSSTKGGVNGTLLSAAKLPSPRSNLVEGDQVTLGWKLSLTNA